MELEAWCTDVYARTLIGGMGCALHFASSICNGARFVSMGVYCRASQSPTRRVTGDYFEFIKEKHSGKVV